MDRSNWACRGLALFLILAAAVLRILYFINDCPLDLAPDEAHYWDWSRHLDWSYYSKGPLVAWLIRGSCELFGPISVQLTGSEMLAVRLPAVLCGSLLLVSLYVLTVQVFRSERLALAVVATALTVPALAAGASLMTIDAPYTCCWGWALVLGHRALFRGSAWVWAALGGVIGLGILAKYNMGLFVPSMGLFLLTDREGRRRLFEPGFWIMCAVAALSCLPILIWNVQNDWVTFRHVSSLANGMHEKSSFHPLGPLNYVAGQFALLMGYWFVVWVAAMIRYRPTVETDAGLRYLWWLSLPMFAWFLVFSVRTGGGELNWPVTAYASGFPLCLGWLAERLRSPKGWARRGSAIGVGAACTVGLVLVLLVHRSDWLRAVVEPWCSPETAANPTPMRRFDPTCRLRGWRELAAEVDQVRDSLRAQGIEPVIAGARWSVSGEIGFYCKEQPPVFSIGLTQGDRHSQYDLWRPNPVADPQQFRGRTFILVGWVDASINKAFGQVDQPRIFTYREGRHAIASWSIIVGRDFKGFTSRSPGSLLKRAGALTVRVRLNRSGKRHHAAFPTSS